MFFANLLLINYKEKIMTYTVKSEILGFGNIDKMEYSEIDELFSSMRAVENEDISFTLVNPYKLREYSFDLPLAIKALLEINENSKIEVYNILMIQSPLDDSTVNFLSPIVFNQDNATMAQVVLEANKYPEFSLIQPLKSFKN